LLGRASVDAFSGSLEAQEGGPREMGGLAFYRFISFLYRFRAFANFLTESGITGSEVAVALSGFGLNRFQIPKMLECYRRKLYHFSQFWLYLSLIDISSPIILGNLSKAIMNTKLTNEWAKEINSKKNNTASFNKLGYY
jgi:hypothetical protein